MAAALLGGAVLLTLFPHVHPAGGWGYRYDRAGFIAKARAVAVEQHLDVEGWQVLVTADRHDRLELYASEHPDDGLAGSLNPQVVKVAFLQPGRQRVFAAELYPDGTTAGWELKEDPQTAPRRNGPPPDKGPPRGDRGPHGPHGPHDGPPPDGPPPPGAQPYDLMVDAKSVALETFPKIAGNQASKYKLSTQDAGTKRGSRFTWERTDASAGFHPTIDIVVHRGQVVQASTQLKFEDEAVNEYEMRRQVSDWLELAYFVLIFLVVVGSAVFYVFGTLQRRIPLSFAAAYSVANLLLVALASIYGSGPDDIRIRAVLQNQQSILAYAGFAVGFLGTGLFAWAVAGGGWFIAGAMRPKWWSLRLLFSRQAISGPVGRSLVAGVLWGPLLAAIPVVVALLFPQGIWTHRDAGDMVASSPVLVAFDKPLHPLLLSFFGVLVIFVLTRVSSAWMRYSIVVLAGVLFLGSFNQQFRNQPAALLLEAGVALAVSLGILRGFDLLALLTAETAKNALHFGAILLLQAAPELHASGWRLLAVLGAILGVGLILLWKAPEVEDTEEAVTRPIAGDIRREREQLKSEFNVAQRAQRQMLPDNAPCIPGFSFATHCTPAKEVGGDLYDFLPMSRGRLGIAVADVSGKGVPAALYMTLTKGLLTATTQDELRLAAILEQVNGHLHTVGRRKTFVTMALAILDPASKTLEYARAGHNPTVWRSPASGTTQLLTSGGLGLGITGGKAFGRTLQVQTLALQQGDTLVFYSDGLTEAMNPELEQFGEERLMEVVQGTDHLPAEGVRDRVLAEVTRFLAGNVPQDDLTLVVLRVD
jgi:hypothetical protein